MIDALRTLVDAHREALGLPSSFAPAELSVTKFCQRIVQPHTKVLFFVTFEGRPVCIVKCMRDPSFNERLQTEKSAQASIPPGAGIATPKIYGEGMIEGHYAYLEEVIDALPVSRAALRSREKELIEFVAHFPHRSAVDAKVVAERLMPHLPDDVHIQEHISHVQQNGGVLTLGMTHGDFGRPNILGSDMLYAIDWERAGECPFWLIDAVSVLVHTRNLHTALSWEREGVPALAHYTGVPTSVALALWRIRAVFERLYKKYPAQYAAAVEACKKLQ